MNTTKAPVNTHTHTHTHPHTTHHILFFNNEDGWLCALFTVEDRRPFFPAAGGEERVSDDSLGIKESAVLAETTFWRAVVLFGAHAISGVLSCVESPTGTG